MSKFIYILVLTFFALNLFSQGLIRTFSKTAFTAQFAGSTGLFTLGVSKVTARDKIEVGLLYGRLPHKFGGINNSLVLKFTFNPFQFDLIKKVKLEPLQLGVFLNQNFNKDLGLKWDDNYYKGYYWWTRSLRFHFFAGTQLSYMLNTKNFDRISSYFEVNTNDLYIASYLPNSKSLSLYDILFFGTGIKLYIN